MQRRSVLRYRLRLNPGRFLSRKPEWRLLDSSRKALQRKGKPAMTSGSTPTVTRVRLERRLSDLVELAEHPAVRVLEPLSLRRSLLTGDPVLYAAYRDVQTRHISPDGGTWRADEVHYASGALPSGEAVRSIGHWNTPDQIEVFQVLSGRVIILVAMADHPEYLSVAEYGPGVQCVIPPGAFHLTYSPWEPSVVFNVYHVPDDADGRAAEHGKYERDTPPPFTVLVDQGHTKVSPVVIADNRPLTLAASSMPADIRTVIPTASDDQLHHLRSEIEASFAAGWPLR